MKINEVAMHEAEPNYEVNPAQARLAAIAVKLMNKAETVTDENLQIALSRVAQHLPQYGTAFGAKNMQDLLDIVNGEGKHFDPDLPQDNKNPIKVSKESLMKMMAFGQQMVDKEGTVQPDIKEDVEDYEKVNARRMIKQLRAISEHRRMLENMIIKLADMNKDSGDLTDQLQTMFDLNTKFSGVLRRAMKIVPVYEGISEDEYRDGHDINLLKAVAKQVAEDARDNDFTAIDDLLKDIPEAKLQGFLSQVESVQESIPTSEFDYDLKKFYDKVMDLEDQNQHGEVAEMLVNLYGTSPESMVIRGINGMHSAQGSIMPEQQKLRDMISTKYYKKLQQEVETLKKTSPAYTMRNEGVISDLFTVSKDEKRLKQRTGDSYDAAMVDKHTKKFEKQGLSPEDARKYAYRKVFGK